MPSGTAASNSYPDSIKNSVLSKPTLPQPEAPRLKMPQPNKIPLLNERKKPDFKKTKIMNIPKKPLLTSPDLPNSIPKLPKVKNKPVLLNPLTSKKSKFLPSQMDLPKIEMKNIQPKNLSNPEFSKPKDPEFEKLLKILTPSSTSFGTNFVVFKCAAFTPPFIFITLIDPTGSTL